MSENFLDGMSDELYNWGWRLDCDDPDLLNDIVLISTQCMLVGLVEYYNSTKSICKWPSIGGIMFTLMMNPCSKYEYAFTMSKDETLCAFTTNTNALISCIDMVCEMPALHRLHELGLNAHSVRIIIKALFNFIMDRKTSVPVRGEGILMSRANLSPFAYRKNGNGGYVISPYMLCVPNNIEINVNK